MRSTSHVRSGRFRPDAETSTPDTRTAAPVAIDSTAALFYSPADADRPPDPNISVDASWPSSGPAID